MESISKIINTLSNSNDKVQRDKDSLYQKIRSLSNLKSSLSMNPPNAIPKIHIKTTGKIIIIDKVNLFRKFLFISFNAIENINNDI